MSFFVSTPELQCGQLLWLKNPIQIQHRKQRTAAILLIQGKVLPTFGAVDVEEMRVAATGIFHVLVVLKLVLCIFLIFRLWFSLSFFGLSKNTFD